MPTPRRYASPAERQAAYRRRQTETRRMEQKAKGLPPLPAVAAIPGHARWQALLRQAGLLLGTWRWACRDLVGPILGHVIADLAL